ncbi:MAG TPA: hypothetical protein VG961_00465 [Ignavibacteria bacterium]|nr:hypothetical protein [Ignavibacteria bacterium]
MAIDPKDPFEEDDDDEHRGEGFDPEEYLNDMDEDDYKEAEEEIKNERKRLKEMPLYKSAVNIRKLTTSLAETINEEDDALMMKEQMLMNAFMLGPKIAGAEAGDMYTLRMENAVLIKIHARELLKQTSFCKAEKLSKPEYLKLLRDEIENFRKHFVDWVKTFDKENDIKDDWGLFYD